MKNSGEKMILLFLNNYIIISITNNKMFRICNSLSDIFLKKIVHSIKILGIYVNTQLRTFIFRHRNVMISK